ncbi:MAG: ATP-binding protein [Candidatus Cryptobacteroides sp.]
MRFSDITGNEQAVSALRGMVDSGRVPHALMMYENEGGGALALALAFLQYLNCPHRSGGDSCGECPSCRQGAKLIYPDIHFSFPVTSGTKVSGVVKDLVCDMYAPYWRELVVTNPYFLESEMDAALGFEKKQGIISVAEGKAIIKELSLSPHSGKYRAVVMWLPERMTVPTANMLLKTIEEPPENTVLIFITHSPGNVLSTVSSRCQGMRILPLSKEEVAGALVTIAGASREDAAAAAEVAGGSIGEGLHELSGKDSMAAMKDIFREIMDSLLRRDLLGALEASEKIAAMESREKQKLFCTFAGESLRKVFLIQQGMEAVAALPASDADYLRSLAASCRQSFAGSAIDALGKAVTMIDRNVNQKIIFTNLIDRLFVCL